MDPKISFIDEILAEAEIADRDRRVQLTKVEADQYLMGVKAIEDEMAEISRVADKEVEVIRAWAMQELDRLDRKRQWLVLNLEAFLKFLGEKTVRLPHGTIKSRKSKERIFISSMDEFLPTGLRLGLVRVKESQSPDLQAILEYTRRTGEVLPGTNLITGEEKFYYSTNGKDNHESE